MIDFYSGLHPDLVTRIKAVLLQMARESHPMKPCQGVRTAEYQHKLWLQGRDPRFPGPIITNCDGHTSRSAHQPAKDGLGTAIDCCFEGPDPFGNSHPWARFGALAEEQGLVWGGRFKMKDLDHVELPKA